MPPTPTMKVEVLLEPALKDYIDSVVHRHVTEALERAQLTRQYILPLMTDEQIEAGLKAEPTLFFRPAEFVATSDDPLEVLVQACCQFADLSLQIGGSAEPDPIQQRLEELEQEIIGLARKAVSRYDVAMLQRVLGKMSPKPLLEED